MRSHPNSEPAFDDDNTPKECPVCMDGIHPVSECRLRCGHSICSQCITRLRKGVCPVCRKSIFPEDERLRVGQDENNSRVGGGGHVPSGSMGSSHNNNNHNHSDIRSMDYRSRQHTLRVPATRTALLRNPPPSASAMRGLSENAGLRMQSSVGQLHFSPFCV